LPHREGGRERAERREEGKEKLGKGKEKLGKPKVCSGVAVEARENDEKPLSAESAPNTQNHTIGDPTAAGFWDDVEWCSARSPTGILRVNIVYGQLSM